LAHAILLVHSEVSSDTCIEASTFDRFFLFYFAKPKATHIIIIT